MSRNYKFHNPEGLYFVSFLRLWNGSMFLRGMSIGIFCRNAMQSRTSGVEPKNTLRYFRDAGYGTTPRGGQFVAGAAIRSINEGYPIYLDTTTGITKTINGVTYRFNHGISITGYKQFDNGKILWQVFNPSNGSMSNRYILPTINRTYYNVNHISRFFKYLPFN